MGITARSVVARGIVFATLLAVPLGTATLSAQGVTTSSINARVLDEAGVPREGARIVAIHAPSGTRYEARTRQDGRATIPGMRVGGPYTVTAALLGFEPSSQEGVFLALGVAADLRFTLRTAAVRLSEITVTPEGEAVFSSDRTGAATTVGRETIARLPTISARIEDFIRLTPQSTGGFSFGGADRRLNNITVDGSYFNNSFGLGDAPGDRTNVAPISMDAIEQVQVNVSPYDVRQGNFVGAGINTVTRSGTNEFQGSAFYAFRDNRSQLHGTKARSLTVDPGEFEFSKFGLSLGGPILRDKLFFFVNYESDGLTEPGTTFRANTGGETPGGNITRVLRSDLDALSTYLGTNFGYTTGPYQGYSHQTPAQRFMTKVDYNIDSRNKVSLRYSQLDSDTDVLVSNSTSLGFGDRRTNLDALNFQNSNYKILENIRSFAGELNSILPRGMHNSLIVGYSHHDESRGFRGQRFPLVDIKEGGDTYTTFGFEPFTPNNELRYGSWQLQNNLTKYLRNHELTLGLSAEWYESENVFFPGSQSVYVYNSLADFYADADDFLAQCGTNSATWDSCSRATSPVTLDRFQVRWSNIPGQSKPVQPLEVFYAGLYAQDQWRVTDDLRLTFGLRLDRPSFGNTAFVNSQVDGMNFRDENGNTVKYSTSKLPEANIVLSPRFGFNWDVSGDRTTQVRGGSGMFSGRPAYVWISNQVGENGVLTGFEALFGTAARPFHPNPDHYKPTNVTGAPAASYGLAFTEPDFKFPGIWRSNIGVDRRLPFGLVGTAEFLYSRDVNGIGYVNANLSAPDGAFTGADRRPRWNVDDCPTVSGTQQRVNCNVTGAFVFKNVNEGRAWNIAGSLERPFARGIWAKAAYSYGESKNTINPGFIAFGSWTDNPHSGDPNNPSLGFAATSPGHRLFAAGSWTKELFRFGATTAALFWETRTQGNASYTFSGDLNGDGGSRNDLIYIPRDQSEMNFETYSVPALGVTFTAQQQADAWEAYIQQDEYLREHRGQYAERNAVFLPRVTRLDFSLSQEIFRNYLGHRNGLQIRLDFLNFGNLLNKNWGVGQRLVNNQPLIARGADASGAARYRLRNIGSQLMSKSLEQTAGIGDVYRIQLQVRYNFN